MPTNYCSKSASAFHYVDANYGLPTTSFKAPLMRVDGFPQTMGKGDYIARCFIPPDLVVLDVPGETLRINNTIISITDLITAMNPISGAGLPNKSPTGYGSKSTLYIDTVGKIVYFWTGSQWIPMCGCQTTTVPTVPVTPTCTVAASPASMLDSGLTQGTSVSMSVAISNAPSGTTATVVSGALPSGISANYTGNGTSGTLVLSGTPAVSGSFSAVVRVGTADCNVNIPVALTVASNSGGGTPTPGGGGTPTTPTNCNLVTQGDWVNTAIVGTPFVAERNMNGSIPSTATLQLVAGSLPSGFTVSLNWPVLRVSGTATSLAQGQYAVYRFTDAPTGCVSAQFQVRVDAKAAGCSLVLPTPTITMSGTVGTALATSVPVQGEPNGTTVLLESGALPAGVTASYNQSAHTFVLSGTPTAAGTYNANFYVGTVDCWKIVFVTITVANAVASCTITSNKAQIADATLVVGVPMIPQTVVISNLPPDATTTAVGDALPAGITVTPSLVGNTLTAVFAGTPAVAGNFNSAVRVGNAAGCAVTIPIGFSIANASSVPTPTPGGGGGTPTPTPTGCNVVATPIGSLVGTVGTPVPANTYTHSITGLGTNLTTTVLSGSLAPGVTVGAQIASGTKVVVGGTPTTAGNYSAVVRVSDGLCYVDVTVAANVTTATPTCALALTDSAKNHLRFTLGFVDNVACQLQATPLVITSPVDITRSYSSPVTVTWLDGNAAMQNLALQWTPKTGTWGAIEPVNATSLAPAFAAMGDTVVRSLNGQSITATFRATMDTCYIDFPVTLTVVAPATCGNEGGA